MLGLGLGKHLPPFVKQPADAVQLMVRAGQREVALWRRRRWRRRVYAGGRVAIAGPINTKTGIGRGARLMLEDLRRQGVTVEAFDMTPVVHAKTLQERRDVQAALASFAPTDIVYHLNPPEFRLAILHTPAAVLRQACVVGYWAWELERLPEAWAPNAALCDELWTCSPFVESAMHASLPGFAGAIRVKPHPVDLDPAPPVTPERRIAARRALNVPDNAFVVGTSFAVGSNFERKNPLAAIAAFQAAFPPADDGARLLLRCSDFHLYPAGEEMLRAAIAGDVRIRLLTESAPIFEFYHGLEVFISLHRSEGFGLNLVEAAQAGIDVVTTGWSLGPDVLNRIGVHPVPSTLVPVRDPQGVYANIKNARWAEPDIAAAAALLRQLRAAAKA